jgi:hypothetical protein
MAIAWLVFMVWVVFDAKRIGLGGLDLRGAVLHRSVYCLPGLSGHSGALPRLAGTHD